MNELSTLAKFIYNTASNDTLAASQFATRFNEEIIPSNQMVTQPTLMFVGISSKDIKGAFGARLFTTSVYQIKAVVEGDDFSILEKPSSSIDRLFDWQNQLIDNNGNPTTDPNLGRPRSQFVWQDPDDVTVQLVIMCSVRNGPIKHCTYADGVNYCNQGGEYRIDYYLSSGLQSTPLVQGQTLTIAQQLEAQIVNLQTQIGALTMSIHALPGAKYAVAAPITATATVAVPTNSTSYAVTNTSVAVITLPIATGSGVDLEFVKTSGAGFAASFALNAADSSPGALANTALAGVGDVQSFRDVAPNVWEAH